MGLWTGVKKVAKPFVDVSSWANVNQIKTFGGAIVDMGKSLFIPQQPLHEETFEEAARRLRLTEKDIKDREQQFRYLTIVFSIISLSLLGYFISLIIMHGSIFAKIVTFVLFLIVLAKLFSYHFWLYQTKQRRLGCTLREWFREGLLGIKK